MEQPNLFDPLHIDLSGTVLIEASAGTGKTHTIASLVVRLVVEKNIPIEKILVVTFTEAASAELKGRIYARLTDMLVFLEKRPCGEKFSQELGKTFPESFIPIAKSRLLASLRNFDCSLIGTIHSFCYRMLRENRLESGMRFDAELVRDDFSLMNEAAQDVWRMEVVPLPENKACFLMKDGLVPDRLAKLAKTCARPDQKILPQEREIPDGDFLWKDFEKKAEEVRKTWKENRENLQILLLENPDLNRNRLRFSTLKKGFSMLDQWRQGEAPPDFLKKLTVKELRAATKKGGETPSHPFFELCGLFLEAHNTLDKERMLGQAVFLAYLIRKTHERADFLKEKKGVFTYDDLLFSMREAVLKKESGMTERVRSLFCAALIDEFQDTDTVQYTIFDEVFTKAGKPLFLIGDPKQAIYSFRGADVFAYLGASRHCERSYTLMYNWRSDPALIRGVNRIFSKNPRAFLLDGLDFHPVREADHERKRFDDEGDAFPLRIWKVGCDPDGNALNIPVMQKKVITAMADEIIRLLEGGRTGTVQIDGKGIGPGDIAVIVRKNDQAVLIRKAFSERGIPAVIQAEGNVLESEEAGDLEILMYAILNPADVSAIRRSLATKLMAFSLGEILWLNEDERAFAKIFTAFSAAKNLWREKGVFPMLMFFYERFEILVHAASFHLGERKVTNLLHLAEILHQAEISENLDSNLLFGWLSRQRREKTARRVEAPLRLESDENRVRIVTIHKAKGLEYPIVFCPFIAETLDPSNDRRNPEKILFYHDGPEMKQVVHLDDGGSRAHEIERYRDELVAEGVRLLYVAMTRACHKLYLVWGAVKNWEKSAAAWVFHGDSEKKAEMPEKDLRFLEDGGDIAVSDLPDAEGKILSQEKGFEEVLARRKHETLEPDIFRITSFSSLAAGSAMEEPRDMDGLAGNSTKREEGPSGGIFAFPAGSGPGTFMHSVFEHVDFTLDHAHFIEVGKKLLAVHGYDLAWAQVIAEMVERVVNLPMGPEKISLRNVPMKDQLRELDFYLPLKSFDPLVLTNLVCRITNAACGEIPKSLERVRFSKTEGYLRGVMDLVFRFNGKYYLLDWKSNYLGDTSEDYRPEKLAEEMAKHLYILQYHLYILALDRHLSLHLADYDYERDFGGVAYVFLRGVDPARSSEFGLFQDRPEKERIRELAGALLEEPGMGLSATGV